MRTERVRVIIVSVGAPPLRLLAERHSKSNAVEQLSIIFEHGSKSIELSSMWTVCISRPKPSGLGMVSIFKASAARTLVARLSRNDACGFWPHGLQYGQTGCGVGSCRLLHWRGNQDGKDAKAVALQIRTALASGYADDTGHVGRCRVCPEASRTQRLLR
jgi:hypothetical protein